MCSRPVLRFVLVLLGCLGWRAILSAQAKPSAISPEVDLAIGYNTTLQNSVSGSSFWQQGGFAELSADIRYGLGMAALVKGGTATNINNTGLSIDTVTVVFGPRYTFRHARLAVFGEGLIGQANAFHGAYPSSQGAIASTNSFASVVQGGFDVSLSRRFALRIVQAGWERTQFPNATTNVQNALTIGTGICIRIER